MGTLEWCALDYRNESFVPCNSANEFFRYLVGIYFRGYARLIFIVEVFFRIFVCKASWKYYFQNNMVKIINLVDISQKNMKNWYSYSWLWTTDFFFCKYIIYIYYMHIHILYVYIYIIYILYILYIYIYYINSKDCGSIQLVFFCREEVLLNFYTSYVADIINKLKLCLLIIFVLFKIGSVYRYLKQPVSNPDSFFKVLFNLT